MEQVFMKQPQKLSCKCNFILLVLLLCFRFGQRSSENLVGFTEMGDINEEMQELQYSVNEEDSNRDYFSKTLAEYEEHLATWNVQLDTMNLLVLLEISYFQLFGRQLGYWRALVLKSVTGYAPNRSFFLINGLEQEKRGTQY